ncbi:hypothetical protein TIFTF001_046021 [Ficus carica]|uniref:RNase H type-1 domain-containing protein n=1 Tax=Ficus carica TaxID=3494 RepID=A0AA87Z0E4_FICCA|nr:hypothetical protein TIFTF001_046021 [Ficus carica]
MVRQAFHRSLPARFHLARRGVTVDLNYSKCGDVEEDSCHSLWLCHTVWEIWMQSAIDGILERFKEHGYVKLNVDVAIDDAPGFIGIRVVEKDDRGVVLGTVSRWMAGLFSPHVGECLAQMSLTTFAILVCKYEMVQFAMDLVKEIQWPTFLLGLE